MKKISIVTGVYNEEAIVNDVYQEIKRVFKKLGDTYQYEHIFMDNCSTDNTLPILKRIAAKDKNIKILSYSKNFGPEKSGFTGLIHTRGDAVIPYEGSMKDPADLIPTFLKYWEEGYQVVYGVRKKIGDNFFMSFLRRCFYRFIRFLSAEELPLNVGSFSLIDKKIINELKKINDYKPYVRGLILTAGYKHKSIEYTRGQRKKGFSKSNLGYLIDFTFNATISYSISPIRFCTYTGLTISCLSFVTAITYLILHLFFWKAVIPGVAGIIFLILLFSGLQLFFLGIIGEYIGAIHSQVRQKPFVIINEKINFSTHTKSKNKSI
ncbi:glycosyltransferase family 2 protein [soil metagenome]